MRQLEDDLNFISSLPDRPAMATADLKREFDKAGNAIKDFINEKLETDITADIATCLDLAKGYTDNEIGGLSFTASNISYDGTSSGMTATNVQDATDEVKETLEGEMTTLQNTVNQSLSGKIASSDFVLTTHEQGVEPSYGYNYESRNVSFTKSGYKALGCVGWTITNDVGNIRVDGVRTTSIGNGTISLNLRTYGNTSGRNHGTFTLAILWVKQ